MKTLIPLTQILGVAAVLIITSLTASAQLLTADNPSAPANETSISVGTNDVLGYFFAATVPTAGGSQADISSLPGFVTSVTSQLPSSFNGGSGYASISVGGTSYITGVDYSNSGSSSYEDVGQIQLTSSLTTVIPTFQIGVLTGSAGIDPENDNLYNLSLFSSLGVQIGSSVDLNTAPDFASPTTDDFFYATVSGATSGDYLEIGAAQNPNAQGNLILGGVTISSATTTVPEPATYALLLGGLLALGALTLRRREA